MKQKIDVPSQLLLRCYRQVQQKASNGDVDYFIHHAKYNEWLRSNKVRVESIFAKLQAIDKSYCAPTIDGKDYQRDEEGVVKLLDGKSRDDYQKEYDEVMTEQTVMEV